MGFMRKALFVYTGGVSGAAGIKANSKKERTAKAMEKQVRLQKQMLKQQASPAAPKYNVECPRCSAALISPAGDNIKCPKCGFRMKVWAVSHAPAVQPPAASGTAGELERLVHMHRNGALTDAEFAAAKKRVLGA